MTRFFPLLLFFVLAIVADTPVVRSAAFGPPPGFVKCAEAGQLCRVSKPGRVIYGANSSFTAVRAVSASVMCDGAAFGDKVVRAANACYLMTDAEAPPPDALLFNIPPPDALFRVPSGWSSTTISSSSRPTVAPPQCQRKNGVVHVATMTGHAAGGNFTYTICETDTGIVGWWSIVK